MQAATAAGWLTQEELLGGIMLFDARSGYKNLICLVILWTVRHCWKLGERFAFNCYNY